MKWIRPAILAGLLWSSLLPITAPAEELVLDIETAVTTALENNLDLQVQRLELAGLERRRRTAWNTLLPSADARVSTSRGLLGPNAGDWELSLGLQAGVTLAGSIASEIRGALLDYQRGLIDLEKTGRQLERDVRIAYYGLLLARRKIELVERNIETSAQRYELARAGYESGRTSELEMLNALVALENLKPKLDKERLSYEKALLGFKQDLNLDPAEEVVLTGSIDAPGGELPQGGLATSYLPGRLDIQALVKEREILENSRRQSALDEFAPILSLSYSYAPGLTDPWSSPWSGGDWETRSSLGLSVSIPLDVWLPSSKSRLKVREEEDDLTANALALAARRLEAEIEIRSLLLEVENARRSAKVAGQNLMLARRVYSLTEQEYNAGVSDFLTLQEADDSLRAAQLELLTASYDVRVGLLNLEYALNTRFKP